MLGLVRTYRQTVLDPRPIVVLATIGVIAYTFAGFFVYWLITGSGTIGIGGRVSDFGSVIWLGPFFVLGAVYLIGRRGPFAVLWREPIIVSVNGQTLAWEEEGRSGSTSWDAVTEIRPRFTFLTTREAVFVSIAAADGHTIIDLPMTLTEVERVGWRRRKTTLLDLAVAYRPDRFRISGRALARKAVAI